MAFPHTWCIYISIYRMRTASSRHVMGICLFVSSKGKCENLQFRSCNIEYNIFDLFYDLYILLVAVPFFLHTSHIDAFFSSMDKFHFRQYPLCNIGRNKNYLSARACMLVVFLFFLHTSHIDPFFSSMDKFPSLQCQVCNMAHNNDYLWARGCISAFCV